MSKRKAAAALSTAKRPKVDPAAMAKILAEKAKLLKAQLAKHKLAKITTVSAAPKAPAKPKANPYLAHRQGEESATGGGSGEPAAPLPKKLAKKEHKRLERLKGGIKFVEQGAFANKGDWFRANLARAEVNVGGDVSKVHMVKDEDGAGTAAVISPVGQLSYEGKAYDIGDGSTGELALKLFDEIMGIQYGQRPDPFGWITEVVPGSK